METAEFLRSKSIEPSVIADAVRSLIGFEPADVLLVVGSLAEGLGNTKSDLDLLLITARGIDKVPEGNIALAVGRCLFDIQVVRFRKIEEVLAQLAAGAAMPWDITRAANITPDDRRLLHRALHGSVIFEGESNRLAALRPAIGDLARLKLQIARHISRTIQVDMAGHFEAGDYPSLVFSAQDLLGHAVDALAAGHYLTNPTAKWRSRVLDAIPPNWECMLGIRPTAQSATQRFWSLHRAPEQPDRCPALQHAFRIAGFARAVFAWAERRLVGENSEPQSQIVWSRVERWPNDAPLPYLHLDVDFSARNGGISIGRLNEYEDPLDLTSREFEVTLLFDGSTTAREAEIAVFGTTSDRRAVDGLLSRVAQAGLTITLG